MNIKLSKKAKEWMERVAQTYEWNAEQLDLLKMAASCLDRIIESQKILKLSGSYFVDKAGATKMHPALKVELTNKTLFLKILKQLGLSENE